ncbi:MAG: TraR/DksA family transcriptional regulator [Candidatus Abyssobacteria bacterium SURF_5]|uniref:TraR/DksA family transcriptional regulator n=1 Tax=Abyssobacteria bacterium (strain SURF_5) TaxID=2093360 RepID=A0A3A4NVI2_ABYX5|nr:MAG: TraR/DksA family transcriptional regulator [Candidatus Abyssubacteria bacterium SURF_5]
MNKKQLAQFKKQLEQLRADLGQELQQISESNLKRSQRESTGDLSGYSYHMADVGTDNFGREMELNIASSGNERLRLIEEALERIEESTFGLCLSCGAEVSNERLKALPYARLCIDCARESEKKY